MNVLLFAIILIASIIGTDGCANHSPQRSRVPNSFLGTVQQGCTPGAISSVQRLLTDPSKCNLPAGPGGCDLCKLRLYLPETTASRFLVQPLRNDLGLTHAPHIEGTACRCSDGCFFHKSSITKFGEFPLPKGITGRGTFSEPFGCYSGSSVQSKQNPTFTYLIWCETDGGCENDVVARFSHAIRFELLSPNRPTTKSIFTAKITTLPRTKCVMKEMSEKVRRFIVGKLGTQRVCEGCKFGAQCRSKVCYDGKCIKSVSRVDRAQCGISSGRTGPKYSFKEENDCVRGCFR